MSWRETLGVTPSTEPPCPHNTQNEQNPPHIADSAYTAAEGTQPKLLRSGWRETLGAAAAKDRTLAQNTHDTHKAPKRPYFADIADSVHREPSGLFTALAAACRGTGVTPAQAEGALAPVDDWHNGALSPGTVAAFVRTLVQRRKMDRGERPAHYSEAANCERCGPVWLWFSGEVEGCPWCWNRLRGLPIPRP